jgi:hypothetical protein
MNNQLSRLVEVLANSRAFACVFDGLPGLSTNLQGVAVEDPVCSPNGAAFV